MPGSLLLAQDETVFLKKAAQTVLEKAAAAVEKNGFFTLVLSGGKTPRKLYSLLADSYYRDRLHWAKIHVFWGDERKVPPNHPDSNYKSAFESLLSKVPLPASHIYRIPAEMTTAVEAARAYDQTLKNFFRTLGQKFPSVNPYYTNSIGEAFPRFDLILLGLGEDGHTASLFPNSSLTVEKTKWVAGGYVENVSGERITLTLPVINSAHSVLFLCAGESKSTIVREIFREDGPPFPAKWVRPTEGDLEWLLDKGAALKLPAAVRYSAQHI